MVINYDWGNDVIEKERPNFRIVEKKASVVDYDDFKDDFMNPHITVSYLIKKHKLSKSDYRRYRQRVLDEENITRKPTYIKNGWAKQVLASYIQKVDHHEWIIVKTVNHKRKYFGRYNNYEDAQKVRDELVRCDWDADVAEDLMLQYSMSRRKQLYNKAKELFPVWEDYYLNSKKPIVQVNKELGVSARMYKYLMKMIREKYGIKYRKSLNDIASG